MSTILIVAGTTLLSSFLCSLFEAALYSITPGQLALMQESGGPGAKRLVRLREAGVDDEGIARLQSPIGIDIGARTPEETAVSIVAVCCAAGVVFAAAGAVLMMTGSVR